MGKDVEGTAQPAGSSPGTEEVLTIAQAEKMLSELPAEETAKPEGAEATEPEQPETPPEAETEPEKEPAAEEPEPEVEQPEETPTAKPSGRAEKRIHELTDKLKAKDVELAQANERNKAWDAAAIKNMPLPRDYVTPDEVRAIEAANAAQAEKQFLMRHVGLGFEHPTDPARNLTAAQIGERLAELDTMADTHAETRAMFRSRMGQFVADAAAGRALRQKQAEAAAQQPPPKPAPKAKVKTPAPAAATRPAPVAAAKKQGVTEAQFDRWVETYGAKQAAAMAAASAY